MLVLSPDGKRILISGYSPELLELVHTLGDARFDRGTKIWSCRRTPAAAWRLAELAGADALPDELLNEAARFSAARIRAERVRQSTDGLQIALPVKTRPWKHQEAAFAFARDFDSCLLALEMGTGKSLVAIALLQEWRAKRVLIVCPKSVVPIWPREFDTHLGQLWYVVPLDMGSVAARSATAERLTETAERGSRPVALVVNYDSVWREPFGGWALSRDWDAIVLDESHRAKAHDSRVSRYLASLGQRARKRLCLTGTPIGQSPLDVFGQFRFLDSGIFGSTWTHFLNRYARRDNPYIPQQITGLQRQEELQAKMAWITYRVRASDVLDLPAKHHVERRFLLGPRTLRAYRELETHLVAEVGGGLVTASTALTKLLRLAQCTSGFLVPDSADKETGAVNLGDEKIEALEEILDGIDPHEPVVCFTRFRHDAARIRALAEKLGRRYGELSGDRRDALDANARLAEGVQVAAVNLQSGGLGVDFTRARFCVFYSVDYSLTNYDQAIARLHRPGQTRPVVYFHLVGDGTIEETIYKALNKRKEIVEEVLGVLGNKSLERRENDAS